MPDYVRVATGGASSALNQNNGYCPVFISETHNYYYLRRNFGGGSLNMMKTSDPRTVSWTEQDAAGNPGEGANVGSAKCFRHPDSQIIHVIYQYTIIGPTDDEYRYAQFNMATDNWDIANETALAF
ncbi:MAG: hypothetical protein GTO41_15715, partial [Burkholderiales bacterium]|nr:hypothetical protein [Burkholderiales bacterium]